MEETEIPASYVWSFTHIGKPKFSVIFGGTLDANRRLAAQRGEKPRMNELEMESRLGAQLYDFGWFFQRAKMERPTRVLTWAAQCAGHWSAWLAARVLWATRHDDVVYATGEDVGLPLAILLRLSRKKHPHIILRLEDPLIGRTPMRRYIFDALLGFALRRIDLIMCRTQEHIDLLRNKFGVPAESLVFVPEANDIAFFSEASAQAADETVQVDIPSDPYIVSAGLELRDYETFIEAVRNLPVQVIIGAGSPWSKFQFDTSTAPTLPPNVRVDSFSPAQMRALYRSARFVVVPLKPTLRSCGITVVLEAWAMRRAVIASRTVGLTNYIKDDETGILVEPRDSHSLRSAIQRLLEQPERAAQLGQSGYQQAIVEYNMDRYVTLVDTAISKLTGQSRLR